MPSDEFCYLTLNSAICLRILPFELEFRFLIVIFVTLFPTSDFHFSFLFLFFAFAEYLFQWIVGAFMGQIVGYSFLATLHAN